MLWKWEWEREKKKRKSRRRRRIFPFDKDAMVLWVGGLGQIEKKNFLMCPNQKKKKTLKQKKTMTWRRNKKKKLELQKTREKIFKKKVKKTCLRFEKKVKTKLTTTREIKRFFSWLFKTKKQNVFVCGVWVLRSTFETLRYGIKNSQKLLFKIFLFLLFNKWERSN